MGPDVAIIGGGIAGLSAAYELSTRGVSFVLLEASDRLGGLIRTERIAGYTIDAGADSMLAEKPAALRLCEELGLGPRLITSTPPRTAYVFADGRLHALPPRSILGIPTTPDALASYDLLSARARDDVIRLGSDLARREHARPAARDESVADFFRRQFGAETVSRIAQPLLGGIHAGDVEALSILSVAPRLTAAEETKGSVVHAFRDAPAPDPDGMFRSLRGGMGELVFAIASRLPPDAIRLNTPARTLARSAATYRVATERETFDARSVLIAAPAYAASQLLKPIAPDLADLCARIPYVSTASVALAWPRASVTHPLNGSGFVVARRHSALRMTACTWVTSKWEDRAPEGMVLLRAFVGGATDPDAADLADEPLTATAARDVRDVLGAIGDPMLACVHRWIRAGAQHNVGHRALVARIEQQLASLGGLFVAGSGFRAIGVPDCIADGRTAGAAAADYVKIQR